MSLGSSASVRSRPARLQLWRVARSGLLDRDRPVPARPGLALIARAPTLGRAPLSMLAAGGGASAKPRRCSRCSRASEARRASGPRAGTSASDRCRSRPMRSRPSRRRAGTTLSRRACRRCEFAVPSGPRVRNDGHRRRERYGRRRRNVARAAGSDFQCGRGEQPVTANRTGTDFTQEDLGAPRRAYYSTNEMQAPAHPLAFVARQKKALRQGFAAAPSTYLLQDRKGTAARVGRSALAHVSYQGRRTGLGPPRKPRCIPAAH